MKSCAEEERFACWRHLAAAERTTEAPSLSDKICGWVCKGSNLGACGGASGGENRAPEAASEEPVVAGRSRSASCGCWPAAQWWHRGWQDL